MNASYIKRTLPMALRWQDSKRRKHFVRAGVSHLHAQAALYKDQIKAGCDEKQKKQIRETIGEYLKLLDGLGTCDFESFATEGPLVQAILDSLEIDLV